MKKITIVGLGNMGLNFINSVNKDFKKNISDIEINNYITNISVEELAELIAD